MKILSFFDGVDPKCSGLGRSRQSWTGANILATSTDGTFRSFVEFAGSGDPRQGPRYLQMRSNGVIRLSHSSARDRCGNGSKDFQSRPTTVHHYLILGTCMDSAALRSKRFPT